MVGDELQDAGRVHVPHHDGEAAVEHPDQRPPRPGDVEHGHGAEVHRVAVEPPRPADPVQQTEEVLVGDHGPLGQPRRPRRVELQGDVVGSRGRARIPVGLRLPPRLVPRVPGVIAEDEDDHHRLQIGLDLLQVGDELGSDHHGLGPGVVDYVGHLRRGQPPVHPHGDGVDLGRPEEHLEVGGAVLVDEGHMVLGTHTRRLQPARHLAGAAVQLAEADRLALELDGGSGPPLDAMGPDDVCHRADRQRCPSRTASPPGSRRHGRTAGRPLPAADPLLPCPGHGCLGSTGTAFTPGKELQMPQSTLPQRRGVGR